MLRSTFTYYMMFKTLTNDWDHLLSLKIEIISMECCELARSSSSPDARHSKKKTEFRVNFFFSLFFDRNFVKDESQEILQYQAKITLCVQCTNFYFLKHAQPVCRSHCVCIQFMLFLSKYLCIVHITHIKDIFSFTFTVCGIFFRFTFAYL